MVNEALKGLQVTVCGMRCKDLNSDTLKMLRTHSSYNDKKVKEGQNCHKTVTEIQRVLKIWKMRNATLEGKIVFFNSIAIHKIVFQSLISAVARDIANELVKIQTAFL